MKKTILIAPFGAGNAAALASALAAELGSAGWSAALALSQSSRAGGQAGTELDEGGAISLSWNPSSYVSTGALLLSAKNALGELDAAVIIAEADRLAPDLLDASPGLLRSALEEALLGPAFLARELLRRFAARRSGRLILVQALPPEAPPPGPAAALVSGAFQGLGEGLFAAARESSWDCLGLLDRSGKPELAARQCLRLLEEAKAAKAGRWLSFNGKPGLFAGR